MPRLLVLAFLLAACQEQGNKGGENTLAVNMSFVSVSDMNDAHFDLRKDGSFEYYRLLFDSIKNTVLTGSWEKSGDTFLLRYQDPEGPKILGSRALVYTQKHEIIFFDKAPGEKVIMVEKEEKTGH